MNKEVVYLACPYTDPDPAIKAARFKAATSFAADMIQAGHIVYSPITMSHHIDMVLAGASNTLGSDYWVAFDEAFMEMCSQMVVIRLDGWDRSSGIKREIAYFTEHKKPIRYVDPSPRKEDINKRVIIEYTNHKGVRADRLIVPIDICFGRSDYHEGEQYFLIARALDRNNEYRMFAVKNIHNWKLEGVKAGSSA